MEKKAAKQVSHPLPPVYDAYSRVLILGTMPSPASRTAGCYYGHPQNRFWKIMAALFPESQPPEQAKERHEWARTHGIALWDVLESCFIAGADDSSISDPVPNDIREILDRADIRAIFTTGSKAAQLYRKYCYPLTGVEAIPLPSSSPANCCNYNLEKLIESYRVLLPYLSNEESR